MISGSVNAYREAVISLPVLDVAGRSHDIEAVLDTGFNGTLTLPLQAILSLGLTWRARGSATLANGAVEEFDICAGAVV